MIPCYPAHFIRVNSPDDWDRVDELVERVAFSQGRLPNWRRIDAPVPPPETHGYQVVPWEELPAHVILDHILAEILEFETANEVMPNTLLCSEGVHRILSLDISPGIDVSLRKLYGMEVLVELEQGFLVALT